MIRIRGASKLGIMMRSYVSHANAIAVPPIHRDAVSMCELNFVVTTITALKSPMSHWGASHRTINGPVLIYRMGDCSSLVMIVQDEISSVVYGSCDPILAAPQGYRHGP